MFASNRFRLPVAAIIVLGGLVLGGGFGLLRSAWRSEAHVEDQRAVVWPDLQIDVCVRDLSSVGPSAAQRTISALDALTTTKSGTILDVGQLPRRATTDCSFNPPFDPTVGQTAWDAPLPRVSARGPFDLVVYVYPQDVVDKLGRTWESRVAGQEYLFTGDHLEPVTPALFVGQTEFTDPQALFRLVSYALGLSGLPNDARPYIDGECLPARAADCGPSYPELAGPSDRPLDWPGLPGQ